jgi:hypothetical protein
MMRYIEIFMDGLWDSATMTKLLRFSPGTFVVRHSRCLYSANNPKVVIKSKHKPRKMRGAPEKKKVLPDACAER